MENKVNSPIYWNRLLHWDWNMHIAATTSGLCFVGSQNVPFESWPIGQKPGFLTVH